MSRAISRIHELRGQRSSFDLESRARHRACAAAGVALCLLFGAGSSSADILDNILSTVNQANNRIDTVRDRTTDLPTLLSNVSDIRGDLRANVLTDLVTHLSEAQDLFEYLQAEAAAAGASSNYPDLIGLTGSLEDLVNVALAGAGTPADFSALTGILQVLPDPVLAVAGQALSRAGIDSSFNAKLDQLALDLVVLQQLVDPTGGGGGAGPGGPNPFLSGGTRCGSIDDTNREDLKVIAGEVLINGGLLRLLGAEVAALAETTSSAQEVGIHGYVSFNIQTSGAATVGKIIDAIGQITIATANSGFQKLRHCESLHYQKVLLDELCTLNRGTSQNCIDWAASDDVLEVRP